MFAGLDEIDWAGMSHAYGPATEVPELLRGLVSADPATREIALDGMYGAVHHQGDVYACTIACVPYLFEVVTSPGGPDRGPVVSLLASIGGADVDDMDELVQSFDTDTDTDTDDEDRDEGDEGEDDEENGGENYRQADAAVAARFPVLLDLLADPDPAVRRAVPEALLVCRAEAPRVLDTLRHRLPAEPDPEARTALVETVGTLLRRAAAGHLPGVAESTLRSAANWLLDLVVDDSVAPALRLTALTSVIAAESSLLPADLVPRALTLLDGAYRTSAPPPAPARFSTDTLLGAVRELREQADAGRQAASLEQVLGGLSAALGDRVEDRIRLLGALLRGSDPERRLDALPATGQLIDRWRGDYRELVGLLGAQLADPHPKLPRAAARRLRHLGELNRPAADVLAEAVAGAAREEQHNTAAGPPAWVVVWPSHGPTVGDTLAALARLGDARALPPLRWALERDDPPKDVGAVLSNLGPAAVDLLPLVRRQLRRLDPESRDFSERLGGLSRAVGVLGPLGAPALPELLPLATDGWVIRQLGRLGQAAEEAVPVLRPLLDSPERGPALAAVAALYQITGDPGPLLPVLGRFLDRGGYDAADAAWEIAEIGPAAVEWLPRLRKLLRRPDPPAWLHLRAAGAVWRVAGDAETVLPVLSRVWERNAYTRPAVARLWAEIGPPAAAALPLLRDEQARPRRHTAVDHGWSSSQVTDDEELLRLITDAVRAIDSPPR